MDHGVYCVDVAVVNEGAVPTKKGKTKAPALKNQSLISFAEAKKLVVYTQAVNSNKRAAQSKVVRMMVSNVGQKVEEKYPQTGQ